MTANYKERPVSFIIIWGTDEMRPQQVSPTGAPTIDRNQIWYLFKRVFTLIRANCSPTISFASSAFRHPSVISLWDLPGDGYILESSLNKHNLT